MTRRPGSGSLFRRKSDGLWVGSVEVRTADGSRRQKRVTSAMFCAALAKFSQIAPEPPPTALGRREGVRRARKLGTHTRGQWTMKLWHQRGVCHYCGTIPRDTKPVEIGGRAVLHFQPLVKDHMIPISRGGSDAIDNIVGACAACNLAKGTMTADEYMERRRHA